MKIHVWVPDYVSAMGGIQTLSRFFVAAVADAIPWAEIAVLSKNDNSVPDAKSGVDCFSAVGSWARPQRTAAFTIKLLMEAARDRPDLIISTHANFTPVAYLLQKLFNIPFIGLGNGIEVWNIPSRAVRRALRSANRLLAISEYTRQGMAAELGMSASTICLLPCTFDHVNFTPAPKPRFLLKRYGLHVDQPVILTVARLASEERYKGYDQVLRALPAIRKRFPDVRYVIGGRGPDRPRVVSLIKELGLEDNVILAGYIPEHELCAHYNLCDVFAMPSKGEGFGIVFLEAMACGKPVIAGNKDGSVDAVLNGKLGVLVDPDDVGEIAQALIAVLSRKVAVTQPRARPGFQSEKAKVEKGKAETLKSESTGSQLRSPGSQLQIPDVIFDPEELRRRVIEAYGYKRFVERVRDIVAPFVESKSETRKH